MSLTLGEKLRQAREERGFSISEVAEQTRISSLYLQSIENDNYKTLPGGIFNKGFVKSFAKFVGLNEQEALEDYSQLISQKDGGNGDDLKVFRPEVLTDDRSTASMAPTIIIAAIILALMTVGVLFLVDYIRQPSDLTSVNNVPNNNGNVPTEVPAKPEMAPSNIPDMSTLRVEFKAMNQPVPIVVVSDGVRTNKQLIVGIPATFEPKEGLTINYNKWNADKLELLINGKAIALPGVPLNSRDKRIEFTISKDNIAEIWSNAAISTEVPPAVANTNTNISAAPVNGGVQARPTPARTPPLQNAPSNTVSTPNPGRPPIDPIKTPAATRSPATNRL